jgi:chemotaxis protein histidine kinase CheA
MPEMIKKNNQNLPATIYKPSELLGMFTAYLSRQDVNSQVIFLRGIYLKNPKHDSRWSYRYDILRDEDTQTEITLQMTQKQSEELKDGNLVTVGGILGRRVQNNSHIQLMLIVSRIEIVQDQVVDENELKRIELRRKKVALGFKNVDGLLEQKLFSNDRPKVALVFATTSITMADFNAGINAAKSAIDFIEYRVNFSSTNDFTILLKQLDSQGYDVIALVRGGGAKVEAADDLWVLETVVNLKTPIIAAIGHVEEKLFIKQIVDKETPTPNGLGQYFSEMVENVSEKKTRSRAVLTEQIKKQFKDQLEAGQKQNKDLQEKLAKLTKAQEEAVKKHNEQVQALTKAQTEATKRNKEQVEAIQKQHKEQLEKTNKQNEELQKKLTEITKANEVAQKAHAEQLGKLQGQMKAQTEASTKQSKEFNESLKKMQETNTELNKSLQKLTAQNTQAAKDLNAAKEKERQLEKQLEEALAKHKGCSTGCLGIVAAIISISSVACWVICLII